MTEVLALLAVVGFFAWLASRLGRRAPALSVIKGRDGERRVKRVVESLGFPAFHDVYLPSNNGTTQIDHVVRVGNCVFVIETKNLSGLVYGTADDLNWRQSFRRGDGRAFLSPLKQNAIHYNAVRRVAGSEADIRPLVVMAGTARFPQGMPAGVIQIDDLKQHLRLAFVDAGRYGTVEQPWSRIASAVSGTNRRAASADHSETVARAARRRSRPGPEGRVEPSFDGDFGS